MKMKMYEIERIIESEFPKETAYEWDNPGLLLGSHDAEITAVSVTLDVTPDTVRQAAECGAQLILSHHPILFGGTKKLTDDTPEGKMLLESAKNGICIYAAHTNCDVGKNGINAYLAELFELTDTEYLEENGLGRIGNLKTCVTLGEFAEKVKEKLNTPHVRICGDTQKIIGRAAIGSGACADCIPAAIAKGADVMLTADMKYHEMLNADACGICVIDAGHYPTEAVVTEIFAGILKDTGLKIVKSKQKDIFKYL